MSSEWLGGGDDFDWAQQQTPVAVDLPSYKGAALDADLRIHNVLALAVLETDRKVELDEAVTLFVNAVYNPEIFPALRIEVKGPITKTTYTVSLFDGGTIQSAGGCMPREAGLCMRKVAKRLRDRLNLKVRFRRFEIHNLLAVIDVRSHVDLAKMYSLAPGTKSYEPSKFPTLRISLPVPGGGHKAKSNDARDAARVAKEKNKKQETITASVFSNGKINFIGGKSVRSVVLVLEELRPFLEAAS